MRYHNITKDDMLNGDGLRVVLWVAGCNHCCPECQNPVTWDPNGGLPFGEAERKEIFAELDKDYVSGITFVPDYLIAIFSSDKLLIKDAVPALKTYFAAFIFMDLQYIGQTVFKSLNKKKQAIFFSLLRKVFIVVPLTYLLPYVFKMGTHGVFLAEPVSNVIGGSLCFVTMLLTILPELKRMEKKNGEADRPMEYFKTR